MSRSVRLFVALQFSLISAAMLSAGPFIAEPVQFPSARTGALGGLHAALADDLSVLLSNPAGLRSAPPQFSAAELTTTLNGPIFSIADLVFRIVGGESATALLLEPDVQKLLASMNAGVTINGPLALGYIGDGLGFGFFNATTADFQTQGTVPTVTTRMGEDLLFVAGYGFRVPLPDKTLSTLDFGFSVKTFTSTRIEWSESVLSFISLFSSPSPGFFLDQPFRLDVGFGLDAGALFNWNRLISVGLAARNLYSPVMRNSYSTASDFGSGVSPTVTYGIVPLDLALGVMYTPHFEVLDRYLSDLKIMLDYNDIFDFWTHPATASNPLLHFALGAEATLLDVLAVRTGFGDGYFSAGLGMNLTAFRFDLAMFGRELSTEPGLRPSFNLIISTQFRY
jgi:hypothetical protein